MCSLFGIFVRALKPYIQEVDPLDLLISLFSVREETSPARISSANDNFNSIMDHVKRGSFTEH